MSNENEALTKYFKSHHKKVVERRRVTGNPDVYEFTDGQSVAYEHILDILTDDELRAKELSKFEK